MEQRCFEPDRGWLGGYWVGEVLRLLLLVLRVLPLDPMVKGGVDMLGEAGPPLALEKVEEVGDRMDTVSGATFSGDWRSREPDIPISRQGAGWWKENPGRRTPPSIIDSPGVHERCWEPWMMEVTDMTGFSFFITIMVKVEVVVALWWRWRCGVGEVDAVVEVKVASWWRWRCGGGDCSAFRWW